MPDQADELRKLVARFNAGDSTVKYMTEVQAAGGRKEAIEAAGFDVIVDHPLPPGTVFHVTPTPNKAKLWDELKADCERLDDTVSMAGGISILRADDTRFSKTLLERMNQAETFATYVRPATDATFARVAQDLKGGE